MTGSTSRENRPRKKFAEATQQIAGSVGLFALTVAVGWLGGPIAAALAGIAAYLAHESAQHGLDGMWKPRLDMVRLVGVAAGVGVSAWIA